MCDRCSLFSSNVGVLLVTKQAAQASAASRYYSNEGVCVQRIGGDGPRGFARCL